MHGLCPLFFRSVRPRLVVFCLKKGYDTFDEQQAVSGLEKEHFD